MIKLLKDERFVIRLTLFITVVSAFFSTGALHADEHYQILEFAGLKIGTTSVEQLPWEYAHQIRPAFQPAIVVGISTIISFFSSFNPFLLTFLLRLLAGGLALYSAWMMYNHYVKQIDQKSFKLAFMWLTFLLWAAVFTRIRFSSENLSGALFIIGFIMVHKTNQQKFLTSILAGLLLGIATIIRFQTGIMVVGLFLWLLFVNKQHLKYLGGILLGGLLAMAIGMLIDRWYYGDWVITVWKYFESNILKDRASAFGTNPWWQYFSDAFVTMIPPFSLLFIAVFLLFPFVRKKDAISWTITPFIMVHFLIAHKELRFLIPLIGFLPIVTIRMVEWIIEKWPKINSSRVIQSGVKLFWVLNFIALFIVSFKTNDHRIALYESIFERNIPMYGFKANPFSGDPEIQFYRTINSTFIQLESTQEFTEIGEDNFLVVTKNELPTEGFENAQLIYQTFPEWTQVVNFNHWMERTSPWKVYEIRRQSPKLVN